MEKSIESLFLEEMIDKKQPLSIYLKNGIRLTGVILRADAHALLLQSEKFNQQLILKHNIATIFPSVGLSDH